MKPYWRNEEHDLTIYHGDCLEVMPELGREFDLCLTDPPYGLNFRGAKWDADIPDWLPSAREAAGVVCFTTAPTTAWAYPEPSWVLCWFSPGSTARSVSGGFNHWTPVLLYGDAKFPVDCIRLPRIAHVQPPDFPHPSPKPIALFEWITEHASEEGGSVLDPFLGSGTTLVACYRLGRAGVGIEISEEYCELAARRLDAEIAQGRLFEPNEIFLPMQEVMSV